MKDFLRGLIHIGVAAGVVTAANQIQSGLSLTSGHVLIPSLLSLGGAVLHSALPTLIEKLSGPTGQV